MNSWLVLSITPQLILYEVCCQVIVYHSYDSPQKNHHDFFFHHNMSSLAVNIKPASSECQAAGGQFLMSLHPLATTTATIIIIVTIIIINIISSIINHQHLHGQFLIRCLLLITSSIFEWISKLYHHHPPTHHHHPVPPPPPPGHHVQCKFPEREDVRSHQVSPGQPTTLHRKCQALPQRKCPIRSNIISSYYQIEKLSVC